MCSLWFVSIYKDNTKDNQINEQQLTGAMITQVQ